MVKGYYIEAKRASQNDPERSITYLCSDFHGIKFENNKLYKITYDTGESLIFKCTRARTTLYSGKLPIESKIECVLKGPNPNKIMHEIDEIDLYS